MKKYILQLILIWVHSLIFGQITTIKSKWILGLKDTNELVQLKNFLQPVEVEADEDGSIYVCSSTYLGYQMLNVNRDNGKVKWSTSRNVNFDPILVTNSLGTIFNSGPNPTDLYSLKNGKLRLIFKLKRKFTTTFGLVCALELDKKTGKELSLNVPKIKPWLFVSNVGNLENRTIPLDDGSGDYHYITSAELKGKGTYTMLMDSNLMFKDTLLTISKIDDSDLCQQDNLSNFKRVGNKFYYMAFFNTLLKFGEDTLGVQFVFYKYQKNKLLIQKSVSSYISNTYWVNVMDPVSDAFLIAGRIGQEYTALNNSDKNIIDANYVAKIDTNGNLLWRSLFDYSDATRYVFRGPVERKDGKGYWLLARGEFNQPSFCVFPISLDGKIGKRIDLDIGIIDAKARPSRLWEMPNGDLLASYDIVDCTDTNANPTYLCNGVFLIEKSKLDLATLATVATELEATACVVLPNPASQEVTLRFQTPQSGVLSILNIQGQSVGEVRHYDLCAQWEVQLPTLASGIYFLQLHFQDGTVRTERLVVAQ
jgi:hypothetical protein